jgi:hypothetical protein
LQYADIYRHDDFDPLLDHASSMILRYATCALPGYFGPDTKYISRSTRSTAPLPKWSRWGYSAREQIPTASKWAAMHILRGGMVDFALFPHMGYESLPGNSLAYAEKWAASLLVPGYAIDAQTAIQVVDGQVEVVSEGHWKHFMP